MTSHTQEDDAYSGLNVSAIGSSTSGAAAMGILRTPIKGSGAAAVAASLAAAAASSSTPLHRRASGGDGGGACDDSRGGGGALAATPLSSKAALLVPSPLPRYLRENPLLGPYAPDYSQISLLEYSHLRIVGLCDREAKGRAFILKDEASDRLHALWTPFSEVLEEERWRLRMERRAKMKAFEDQCEREKLFGGCEGLPEGAPSLEEQRERLTIYKQWVQEYTIVLPAQKVFRRARVKEAAEAHAALVGEAHMASWLKVAVLDHVNLQDALLREERRDREAIAWEALLGGWWGYDDVASCDSPLSSIPSSPIARHQQQRQQHLVVVVDGDDAVLKEEGEGDGGGGGGGGERGAAAMDFPTPSSSSDALVLASNGSSGIDITLFPQMVPKRNPDDPEEDVRNGTAVRSLYTFQRAERAMVMAEFEDEPFGRQRIVREELSNRLLMTMPSSSSRMLKLQETLGREELEAMEAYERYRGGIMAALRQLQYDLWWAGVKAEGIPRKWRGENVGN